MKKLLLIAAFALAALTMRAQTPNGYNPSPVPADSVSVMLLHLANTNAEVQYLNESLRLHSQIALGSFSFMAASGILFYSAANLEAPTSNYTIWHTGPEGSWVESPMQEYEKTKKAYTVAGIVTGIIGSVGFVCSYLPIWTRHIRLDNRGLVISLNK